MIVVDASALVVIMAEEEHSRELAKRLHSLPAGPGLRFASTVTVRAAADRYAMGGGRPGILNFGDCFSYATARHFKAALLFKGDDFGRTDIAAACP